MQKSVASQKWIVFAFDRTDNTPLAGGANQITAEISKDGAPGGGNITDTNPTELEDGYYVFDITAGESNADLLVILPESSTGDIQVIGVPGSIYTTEPNRNKLSVDANGRTDMIKIAGTTQTANDNGSDINDILADTGELQTNQGAWATATGFATSGEPASALVDINLDHLLAVADNDDVVQDSVISKIASADGDWDKYDNTADSLQALRDRGDLGWITATGFAVAGEPLTANEVENAVLDAVLTGVSHNDANSLGRRVRQLHHTTVLREEEQAQGGSASTITFHTDASIVDGFYDDAEVIITGGPGIGQSRHIHAYNGGTRVASVTPDWKTNPDNTSDYVIMSDSEKHVHEIDTDGISADALASGAVDKIWAKAMSDLAGIPGATASALDALNILFMALRNKQTATSATQTLRDDSGATIASATLTDAAGTTTKDKYV